MPDRLDEAVDRATQALDLIAAGHGDRRHLEGVIDRGLAGLRTYVRAPWWAGVPGRA